MAHLYFKAKESFAAQAPKEVRTHTKREMERKRERERYEDREGVHRSPCG